MNSDDDYKNSVPPSSPLAAPTPTPAPLRRRRSPSRSQSQAPTKRRRLESAKLPRVRRYHLEGKYNDAYRLLYNNHVAATVDPFNSTDAAVHHQETQFGASTWSAEEQATFFAAVERLGRDNVPAIARAIGTKTIPEIRDLLLRFSTAASRIGDTDLTLRDIPAAIDINKKCSDQLDIMAEALAWYQERFDMKREHRRYGDYWLIDSGVAGNIERALSGDRNRATLTPATPTTSRLACFRCRKHKIRCDREMPCSNCARSRKPVACEYAESDNAIAVEPSKPKPGVPAPAPSAQTDSVPQILQQIPEAGLLRPENMLTLSRTLFMNRSPDVPSPWPHWSEYATSLIQEPAMLRTAFNDFHTLTVSLTRRLMHTAIIQATSRLRSHRRRLRNGAKPMVKTRDVRAAIDVLGLQRNAKHRWVGAARRCGVRVYDDERITRAKSKKWDLSYEQVEQALGSLNAPTQTDTDVSEPSGDERRDKFKNRAVRSGTPLPMERLGLSDTDTHSDSDSDSVLVSEVDLENDLSESDVASDSDFPLSQPKRDPAGRFASMDPSSAAQPDTRYTLEQFDQEASRQEEQALCSLLRLAPPPSDEPKSEGEPDTDVESEELTITDDWRSWTSYYAEWEAFRVPVRAAKFAANRKPLPSVYLKPMYTDNNDVEPGSGSESGVSARRATRKKPKGPELEAQDPRTYAALRGKTYRMDGLISDANDSEEEPALGADVPAQSVEDTGDAMDWKM